MTEQLPPAPSADQLPEPDGSEVIELTPGSTWTRLYFHAGRHLTRWDRYRHQAIPAPSRFDPFGAPGVDGVAYAATGVGEGGSVEVTRPLDQGERSALATCVAEAAQDTKTLDRLDQRSFAVAELTRPLRVLGLSSDWASRAGAGTDLSTAARRETCAWAVTIATRWPGLDGVAYIAATRPAGRALALWSPRSSKAVTTSALLLLRTLDDPVLRGPLSWAAYTTGVRLLAPHRSEPGPR